MYYRVEYVDMRKKKCHDVVIDINSQYVYNVIESNFVKRTSEYQNICI